jgi:hypothetical protein
MNLTAAQHEQHITRVISWIRQAKPDHRSLTILLFQRLELESISIGDVGLRVVSDSLFVRHFV